MPVMTSADWGNSKHFQPNEFQCDGVNVADKMDKDFILNFLNPMREGCGFPLKVTSSYRTPEHNKEVHGADMSAHMDIPCKSVDLWPVDAHARYVIVREAFKLGCRRIGIYKDGSIHVDESDGRPEPVLWTVV